MHELTASLMWAGLSDEFKPDEFRAVKIPRKCSVDVVKNILLEDEVRSKYQERSGVIFEEI